MMNIPRTLPLNEPMNETRAANGPSMDLAHMIPLRDGIFLTTGATSPTRIAEAR